MTEPEFEDIVGTDVNPLRQVLSDPRIMGGMNTINGPVYFDAMGNIVTPAYEYDIEQRTIIAKSAKSTDPDAIPHTPPVPDCYCDSCEEHYDYWDMLSGEDTRGIDRKLDEKAREEAKDELYGI